MSEVNEKCFCHLNGYEVKDAKARKDFEQYVEEGIKAPQIEYIDGDISKARTITIHEQGISAEFEGEMEIASYDKTKYWSMSPFLRTRTPIVAGDNVTFTLDEENSVIKVNANESIFFLKEYSTFTTAGYLHVYKTHYPSAKAGSIFFDGKSFYSASVSNFGQSNAWQLFELGVLHGREVTNSYKLSNIGTEGGLGVVGLCHALQNYKVIKIVDNEGFNYHVERSQITENGSCYLQLSYSRVNINTSDTGNTIISYNTFTIYLHYDVETVNLEATTMYTCSNATTGEVTSTTNMSTLPTLNVTYYAF